MIQGNGPPVTYQVIVSEIQKQRIKQLYFWALRLGKGQAFLDAMKKIESRLRADPSVFGDPLYPLPALNLLVFQAVAPPLVVHYGVHQEKPLVMIQGVRPLFF